MKRKAILKEAGVLLITAILVLTAIVITGQPTQMIKKANNTTTWLSSAKTTDKPMLPLSTNWIHYDTDNSNAIGLTSGGTFQWAIRLTDTELSGYDYLTAMKFALGFPGENIPTLNGFIYIYGPGTETTPGEPIGPAIPWEHTGNGWVEIPFTPQVQITHPLDLWVSVECVDTPAGIYPAGVDSGPAVDGKGDWVYFGGAWSEIQIYGLDYNWNIWAGVNANNPPNPPSNPNPVEGTVICACDPPCLTWTRGTDPDVGDPVYDEVYISDDLTPPYPDHYVATLSPSDPSKYCLASLTDGLTYTWQIVEIDNHGESTLGPEWSFTTTTTPYFSIAVAVDPVNKNMIDVTVTNTVPFPGAKINNIMIWINFTITGSPAPCVSPNLQYGLIGGGISGIAGKYSWGPNSINKNGNKKFTVTINGGCAYFDVTVTVNSCNDNGNPPSPPHRDIVRVTKQGCISGLTLC